MFKLIVIFLTAILTLLIGYNIVFHTRKTIAKCVTMANYKEGSFLHRQLTSEGNVMWVKVSGILVLLFATILLVVFFWSLKQYG